MDSSPPARVIRRGGTLDPFRFFDDSMNVGLSKTGAGDLFVDGFGLGSPVFLTHDGSDAMLENP